MKLEMTQKVFDFIVAHAQKGYPHEVVGILAGNRSSNHIYKVQPLHNESRTSNAYYKISAWKLQQAENNLEKQGFEILGYYHSHPDQSNHYSKHDCDYALPNMSYLILSIQKGTFSGARSWRICADRSSMTSETLTIL